MAFLYDKKTESKRIAAMSSAEKEEAIARLERERLKTNAEIEGILRAYAKESGNRALKGKKRRIGDSPNDYTFTSEN